MPHPLLPLKIPVKFLLWAMFPSPLLPPGWPRFFPMWPCRVCQVSHFWGSYWIFFFHFLCQAERELHWVWARTFLELNTASESESRSVMSGSLQPSGLYSPGNSPDQNTRVGSLSLLQRNLPNSGIEPRSPALQVDSLPAEPQGKPMFTEYLGIVS